MEPTIPHSLEAEQAILGAILLEPELFENCKLKPESFYERRHQLLYRCFEYLSENEMPIDLLVIRKITGTKVNQFGGISYLVELTKAVPTTANFAYYEGIVHERYLQRKTLVTLSKKAEQSGSSEDIAAFIAEIQESVNSLADELRPEREFVHVRDVLADHDEKLNKRREQKGLVGVKTAGTDLDKLTGGHQRQDLIIVAARPSIGKTAFVLHTIVKAAESGVTCALFSVEMPAEKISERMISQLGHIDGNKIKTGLLDSDDWSKYTGARSELHNLPILIDDTPSITVQEIGSKVKSLKKKHENLLICIDYLQLISGGKKFASTQEEVKFISKYLKRIARENDCPVIVISSLSRSCEQRQDKRPMLSDLRDSGQIEYDADDVIFLYRDDYYNQESEKKNVVEIILAKGRNTGTGVVEMVYMKNYSKFIDMDRGYRSERPHQTKHTDSKRRWAN